MSELAYSLASSLSKDDSTIIMKCNAHGLKFVPIALLDDYLDNLIKLIASCRKHQKDLVLSSDVCENGSMNERRSQNYAAKDMTVLLDFS